MSACSFFKRLPLALFTATVLISVWTTPAFATAGVPSPNPFELDGNAIATTNTDWNNVALPVGNGFTGIVPDPVNSTTDDNFNQGGSKDVRDISSAGITKTFWLGTNTTPPDKDDLEHAFAVTYNVASSTGTDKIIYFGADRFANSGDSAIGFWFFKTKVSYNSSTGTFTGVHTDGDILVTSDFRQGGSASVINVFVWQGTANPANPLLLLQSSDTNGGKADPNTGLFCISTNDACAIANIDPETVPSNWTGGGYQFKGLGFTTSFPQGTFFEGGINIKELLGKNECFASFLAMTRTSASPTAQLKDFVVGNFEQCTASAVTEVHDANHNVITSAPAGSSVHDKVIVTGEIGTVTPTGDVTFHLFQNSNCSGTTYLSTETVNLTKQSDPTATTAGVATAETTATGALSSGSYSYQATYNGDGVYPDKVISACEPFLLNPNSVTVTTDIFKTVNDIASSVLDTAVPAGTILFDVATVNAGASHTDPTGTVTFHRYASANCSGNVSDQTVCLPGTTNATYCPNGVPKDAAPTDGTVKAQSSTVTTDGLLGNFFSYAVEYSGDAIYAPASASVCEPVCSFKTTTQQSTP